jgi:hypothetical protein
MGAQCPGVVTSIAVYAQGAMGARAMRAWDGEPDVRGGLTTHHISVPLLPPTLPTLTMRAASHHSDT